MKFLSVNYIVLLFGLFVFASCNDEPVEPENPEELITTVTYTMAPQGGGDAVVFEFKDLDGDGGDAPTTTVGDLAANTVYTGSVTFLNESESPAEDITAEVAEEDDEHQVFYTIDGADITVEYTDSDGGGNPVGLSTTLTTGATGSGTLTLTLKHEPVKTADGVAGGDITNADGETDVEVVFPVNIQ